MPRHRKIPQEVINLIGNELLKTAYNFKDFFPSLNHELINFDQEYRRKRA